MKKLQLDKYLLCGFICFISIANVFGQDNGEEVTGFYFGPKIGSGIAFQTWNNLSRNPLIPINFSLFVESYDTLSPGSFYAELGYHQRGSSENSFINANRSRFKFQFNNLSLGFGVKQLLSRGRKYNPYYLVGARLEYNLSNNLEQFGEYSGYFPIPPYVNNFTYGITIGGGFQHEIKELIGAALEFSVMPDISKQYNSPQFNNVRQPTINGIITTSIPSQQIRNVSIEVSLVLRLLRQVTYIN